jgi:acetyl-CoA acyltransferase 2
VANRATLLHTSSILKQECDEYAIRSQQTWGAAQEKGIFKGEIAPVEIETRKGTKVCH